MADLQWLKLSTNFFDNNKIKLLESERDGDTLIRVWIQLLTIAMKCNYQGRLAITEDKPMTVDEFSKIMGKSRKKITKCLEKFEELKMIIIEDNFYKIKNWSKYQSADKLEEIRLQNCLRQQISKITCSRTKTARKIPYITHIARLNSFQLSLSIDKTTICTLSLRSLIKPSGCRFKRIGLSHKLINLSL